MKNKNNIYECINITNVLNQLHIEKTCIKGNYIYAVCPFCQNPGEKNGYLKVNTINNVYICKNCERSGSSIDLYANIKYMTTKEAFKRLLKESPVLDNIPYIYNNPVKDEYYRDMVYRKFLQLQKLENIHYKKLKEMGFKDEYINENLFKSIENSNSKKKDICKKLIENGLKLDGIPGFMQDTDFKWTYKSHKGLFIPVILNNKIQGLRIMLDNQYQLETESIWFSSNNEYNGTKASNWPMVLKDKNISSIKLYNSKENTSIIIATEMILAHKLFNNTKKTVIGIPNNIDKEWILEIVNRMKATKVILYIDKYTIMHQNIALYSNIMDVLEEKNVEIDFRIAIAETNIGPDLIEYEENKKIA